MQFRISARRSLVSALALSMLSMAVNLASGTQEASITSAKGNHHWQLGVGCYLGGVGGRFTELDAARFDWVYLCYGNIGATEETTQLLNRLIAMNPRLKVIIRVWPIMNLTPFKENRHQATMYDYFYRPGVKEKLLAETRRQIRVVLDHISKPENVVGSTFLEELPGHFTDSAIGRLGDGETTWAMDAYRKEIEAELGKPFVWNDETRRWWCQKYVQALGEIHHVMKEASEGRLIFYYQQTNHFNLDHVPAGTPVNRQGLIPIHLEEIIKPGLCDGQFAYPNNPLIWERQTLRFAKERGWLFFSQLPHPSGMRLGTWDECMQLAKTRVPQNLGYFWYCEGGCAKNMYNDDPSIPAEERGSQRLYFVEHTRRFLAKEKVGMDVVERHLKPEIAFSYDLDAVKSGHFRPIWVQVHNPRDPIWFEKPEDATLKNVRLTLTPPPSVDLPPTNSPPAAVPLGDIEAGEYRAILWWGQMKEDTTVSANAPISVKLTADNSPADELVSSAPNTSPVAFAPQEVSRSGDSWVEPLYRVADDYSPVLHLTPIQTAALRPSVTDGSDTIIYNGTLHVGERLTIGPGLSARLLPASLITGDRSVMWEEGDPKKPKAWKEGYGVFNLPLMAPSRPNARIRVTISGKVADGAESQILLTGYKRVRGALLGIGGKWESWSQPLVVNALGSEWREGVSQEFVIPADVSVRSVAAYRRGNKGTIWYGDILVTLADMPSDGVDVSDRLEGVVPTIHPDTYVRFTYRDGSPPSQMPRMSVEFAAPDADAAVR